MPSRVSAHGESTYWGQCSWWEGAPSGVSSHGGGEHLVGSVLMEGDCPVGPVLMGVKCLMGSVLMVGSS